MYRSIFALHVIIIARMLSQILRSASGEIEIEAARRKRDESLMNAIGRKENKRFVRSGLFCSCISYQDVLVMITEDMLLHRK